MKPHKKNLIVIIIIIICICFFLAPIFRNVNGWGHFHLLYFQFLEEAPKKTIVDFKQFPLWNPYYCGGNVLLGSPQSTFLTPVFLLNFIFNISIGLKLNILVHYFIGAIGMFYLAKYLGLKNQFSFFAATIFVFSGAFTSSKFLLPAFHPYFFVPLVFLFYLKSFEDKKNIIFTAFFLALMWFEKGIYPLAFTIILLSVYSLIWFIQKKNQRIITNLAIIFLLVVLITAIKSAPYFSATYNENTREIISDWEGLHITELYKVLTQKNMILDSKLSSPNDYSAYGNYVGFGVLVLFLIGVVICWKQLWKLIVISIVFAFIVMGNQAPINIWSLLHQLPLFKSIRFPGRSRFILSFCIALISAFSLQKIFVFLDKKNIVSKKKLQIISFIMIIFFILPVINFNSNFFENTFIQEPTTNLIINKEFIQKSKENTVREFSNEWLSIIQNEGTLSCAMGQGIKTAQKGGIWYYFHGSAIPIESPKYQGEVYLLNNTEVLSNYSNCSNSNNVSINRYMNCSHNISSTANYTYWSPNKLIVEINTTKPDTLIINQNYHEPWKSYSNKKKLIVKNTNDLISVEIKPENKKIMLYYLPTSFIIGSIISITTITGIIMWLRKKHN